MITLESVRRRYPEFELLVDFTVGDEIVALLGASGSGKSTTLRIIAGFESPESGRVLVDGRDVTTVGPQHREIGFVFQDYTLFPHLNVAQNVGYGLRAMGVNPAARRTRVAELLEMVGLADFGGRAVQNLSGGEQQRVAVARALARRPRALLLDEPFSAIDAELREGLRRQLRVLQRALHVPVVFVTHSRNEALSIADRIVLLRAGRVVEVGTPEQLYECPKTLYAARFLGALNAWEVAELQNARPAVRDAAQALFGAESYQRFVQDAAPGGTLMVRPEHLSFGPAEGGTTAPAPVAGLSARVSHRTYHGFFRRYELESTLGPLIIDVRQAIPEQVTVRASEPHLIAEAPSRDPKEIGLPF